MIGVDDAMRLYPGITAQDNRDIKLFVQYAVMAISLLVRASLL